MPVSGKNLKKTLSYTTDSSLLRHVRSGEDAAWNEFYCKYSAMIHAIGKKRKLSAEECDDLMVSVMTVFWKKMENFTYDHTRGRLRNYLGRIANYCSMQLLSRKKDSDSFPPDEKQEYPADVDEMIMQEYQDYLIRKALDILRRQLDTEIYQVFYMSYIQKRPVSEIASVTRKTANNIYVIRSRCLKRMSSVIKELRQLDDGFFADHSHRNNPEY